MDSSKLLLTQVLTMTTFLPQTEISGVEDYFALETRAEIQGDGRHEFHDGVIVAMTGGTPAHSHLATTISSLLWFKLRGKPLTVFGGDLRLWIPQFNHYVYPDGMVVKHPVILKEGRSDTITNPTLIVEVLSNSTKDYDRVDKFAAYRSIPSFQEYLLVDQYRQHIEQYTRQADAEWLFREFDDFSDQVVLVSLEVEMSLEDIYESVDLTIGSYSVSQSSELQQS